METERSQTCTPVARPTYERRRRNNLREKPFRRTTAWEIILRYPMGRKSCYWYSQQRLFGSRLPNRANPRDAIPYELIL